MMSEAATEKQIAKLKELLVANGLSDPHLEGLSKSEASKLISDLIEGEAEKIEAIVRRFSNAEKAQDNFLPIKPMNDNDNAFVDIVDGKWNAQQIQLVHDTVAKGTTPEEFKLFLYQAWRMGLDPLTREIWCVKYGNEPASIFASFSGIQKKAMESGEWDGYDIKIDPEDLKPGEHPRSVTCTMYRKGVSHPVVFTAFWDEFAKYSKTGELAKSWKAMPTVMLRKCAISNAIRQAYPDYVGSIYTPEEMATND